MCSSRRNCWNAALKSTHTPSSWEGAVASWLPHIDVLSLQKTICHTLFSLLAWASYSEALLLLFCQEDRWTESIPTGSHFPHNDLAMGRGTVTIKRRWRIEESMGGLWTVTESWKGCGVWPPFQLVFGTATVYHPIEPNSPTHAPTTMPLFPPPAVQTSGDRQTAFST